MSLMLSYTTTTCSIISALRVSKHTMKVAPLTLEIKKQYIASSDLDSLGTASYGMGEIQFELCWFSSMPYPSAILTSQFLSTFP